MVKCKLMIKEMFDEPYFVKETDKPSVPELQAGMPDRDLSDEYAELFVTNPCFAPVMALTVFARENDGVDQILVAVRDPESNVIHPNVVSTPTCRITPNSLISATEDRSLANQTQKKHSYQIDEQNWRFSKRDHHNDSTGTQMLIDSLLFQKLGINLSDTGYKTKLDYIYAIESLTLGDSRASVDKEGIDIIEKVAMLNVLVNIPKSQKFVFPSSTQHYSDIRFVTPQEYRAMQDKKELLAVYDINAVALCIHGVCIATSRGALDNIDHVLKNPPQPSRIC